MEHVNWKRPLALAALLAVGGIFVYWFENNHRIEKEDLSEQDKKLVILKNKLIDTLSITDGVRTFSFHCLDLQNKLCKPGDQSRWELVEPSHQPADGSATNGLVSALNNLTTSGVLDLKTETPEKRSDLLRDYGLSPQARPSARKVTIKFSDGGTWSGYFGSANPIDQSIYVVGETNSKPDETRVFLVPSFFASNFSEKLVHWRDKKVMNFETSKLVGFELKGSKDHVVGEKKDEKWVVYSKKAPEKSYPGDLENVDALITAANYLVAKDFPAKEVLAGAKPVVTLTLKTPKPMTLQILEKSEKSGKTANGKPTDKKVFATLSDSDVIFELDSNATARLDRALKDLRLTRFLSSMERFAMKKIEISGKPIGPKPLVLGMEGTHWVASVKDAPETKHEIDGEKVQALLDKVAGNRIDDFVEGSKIPPEKNAIELFLSDDKGTKTRRLKFWTYNYKLYAKDLLSKRNEAFIVDTSVSMALPWAKDFFDKKEVPNPAPTAQKAK